MRHPSRAVAVVLVAGIMLSASRFANAASGVSVEGYIARLRASLVRLTATPTIGFSAGSIESDLGPLGLPVDVLLPDGSLVQVTRDSLIGDAGLGGTATALRRVEARLRLALVAAEATARGTPLDRSTLNAALAHAYSGLSLQSSLSSRVIAYVGQALGWLLDHTLGAIGRSGIGAVLAWIVALGLIVAALVVAQRIRRSTVGDTSWTIRTGQAIRVDWRALSEEALDRGDIPEAVRALYHVLLATLTARGVIRDAPSLTSGECRAAVRRTRPSLVDDVDRATAAFERVVYGRLPPRPEDVEVLQAAERAVGHS
jgi:hypothetical protein